MPTETTPAPTLVEKLRDVSCDRQPFTDEHKFCICRLASKAADEIERLGEDLERAYQKDDAKTIEINILVPENRRLAAEMSRLSRELLEATEAIRTVRNETLENLAHDDRAIDLVARAMCRHETEMFARDHGVSVADLPCPDKTAKSTVYRECAVTALSAIRSLKTDSETEVSRERETG